MAKLASDGMQALLLYSVARLTCVPATSLSRRISKSIHRLSGFMRKANHTTVSVTNGVGVQLRGGCASEGRRLEKHLVKPAVLLIIGALVC